MLFVVDINTLSFYHHQSSIFAFNLNKKTLVDVQYMFESQVVDGIL